LVVLDMTVTEELEAKGWAADVIRGIQDARKAADFAVSDRITATLSVPADKEEWAKRHREHIAAEVLAMDLQVVTEPQEGDNVYRVLDGVSVAVQLA
jgi:isoleucine--tRNA ligase